MLWYILDMALSHNEKYVVVSIADQRIEPWLHRSQMLDATLVHWLSCCLVEEYLLKAIFPY